jgi:hypothetical protein
VELACDGSVLFAGVQFVSSCVLVLRVVCVCSRAVFAVLVLASCRWSFSVFSAKPIYRASVLACGWRPAVV